MPKVFISYSHFDEESAIRLFDDLKKLGLEVWLDKECLLPGQEWEREVKKEIESCDFVVLLLSCNAIQRRGYFQKEVRLTMDVLKTIPFGHIYLLPIRLDECDVPNEIAAINYVNFFPDWQAGLIKVKMSIELQSGLQLNARRCEFISSLRHELDVLLVNDQPAAMNFIVDIWKSHGLKVEYAFDVEQAKKIILEFSPRVVVSDLSHYSFQSLITDRAGFEILEWAVGNAIKLNVIITTANISEERVSEAKKLGALGVCNSVNELNWLIQDCTGQVIKVPEKFIAEELVVSEERFDQQILLLFDQQACSFAQELKKRLKAKGYYNFVNDFLPDETNENYINEGAPFYKGAVVIAIFSKDWNRSKLLVKFLTKEYSGYWGTPGKKEAKTVILIIIDPMNEYQYPYTFRRELVIDFSKDYESALDEVLRRMEGVPTYKF